jgi:oxalate---CoA ligase
MVLHTSGTTARPKIVPLSHRNVCASATNIVDYPFTVPGSGLYLVPGVGIELSGPCRES